MKISLWIEADITLVEGRDPNPGEAMERQMLDSAAEAVQNELAAGFPAQVLPAMNVSGCQVVAVERIADEDEERN